MISRGREGVWPLCETGKWYDDEDLLPDSGEREVAPTGFLREPTVGKPRFDLMVPLNVPYEHTMIYRDAVHSAKGAVKYAPRNNELSSTQQQLDRFMESAVRHLFQWVCGETDEDHAAATRWNIRNYEELKWKLLERDYDANNGED